MPTNNHSDNPFDVQAPLDDEQLWDLLSLYVDGEADPAQAAIVEQMLSSDPAYRRDFDFLMQSSQTMHTMEEVEPPVSLRDAVYAKTTGRPTLVGRLRAAWNRVTTPAFGRYASIGGAFAVAVLGAVIVWPHLTSTSGHSSVQPQTVAVNTSEPTRNRTTNPTTTQIPRLDPATIDPLVTLPAKPTQPREQVRNTPVIKPNFAQDTHKTAEKDTLRVVAEKRAPQNYPLQRNNASHTDIPNPTLASNNNNYSYDKKMDELAAQRQTATIKPASNDFGPMVVNNEETSAPTPHVVTPPTASEVKATSDPTIETPAPPKKIIHVVALPPDSKQVIAEAVLRHNQTARYDGYDRNVAENIQRHEVTIDVIKGSF